MTLSDKQKQFLLNLLTIIEWNEPGYDRLKITHRRDGRFQISLQCCKRSKTPLNTVADEVSYIYLSYGEVKSVIELIKRAITEIGV